MILVYFVINCNYVFLLSNKSQHLGVRPRCVRHAFLMCLDSVAEQYSASKCFSWLQCRYIRVNCAFDCSDYSGFTIRRRDRPPCMSIPWTTGTWNARCLLRHYPQCLSMPKNDSDHPCLLVEAHDSGLAPFCTLDSWTMGQQDFDGWSKIRWWFITSCVVWTKVVLCRQDFMHRCPFDEKKHQTLKLLMHVWSLKQPFPWGCFFRTAECGYLGGSVEVSEVARRKNQGNKACLDVGDITAMFFFLKQVFTVTLKKATLLERESCELRLYRIAVLSLTTLMPTIAIKPVVHPTSDLPKYVKWFILMISASSYEDLSMSCHLHSGSR